MSILFFTLAVMGSTPAETATASKPEAMPVAKEERKICKKIAASESRLAAKRVCMTAAEWKRQRNY